MNNDIMEVELELMSLALMLAKKEDMQAELSKIRTCLDKLRSIQTGEEHGQNPISSKS